MHIVSAHRTAPDQLQLISWDLRHALAWDSSICLALMLICHIEFERPQCQAACNDDNSTDHQDLGQQELVKCQASLVLPSFSTCSLSCAEEQLLPTHQTASKSCKHHVQETSKAPGVRGGVICF